MRGIRIVGGFAFRVVRLGHHSDRRTVYGDGVAAACAAPPSVERLSSGQ
jgi:hypothetical protein